MYPKCLVVGTCLEKFCTSMVFKMISHLSQRGGKYLLNESYLLPMKQF
jgi:hypothetical protein